MSATVLPHHLAAVVVQLPVRATTGDHLYHHSRQSAAPDLADPEALVVAVPGRLAVPPVGRHHSLAAGGQLHLAGAGVDVPVTGTQGPVPLRPGAGGGAGGGSVCAGAVVG